MKYRRLNHRSSDCQSSEENRLFLSMYLQTKYYRKQKQLQDLNDNGKYGRLMLYCITGVFFCIGLFFVLF